LKAAAAVSFKEVSAGFTSNAPNVGALSAAMEEVGAGQAGVVGGTKGQRIVKTGIAIRGAVAGETISHEAAAEMALFETVDNVATCTESAVVLAGTVPSTAVKAIWQRH
jgi:hypothetical protein